MRHKASSILCCLFLTGGLLWGKAAWADDCSGPAQRGWYSSSGDGINATEKPINAHPWVSLYPDEVERMQDGNSVCFLSRLEGGEDVPVAIEVSESSYETFSGRGCDTGVAFFHTLVRMNPDALLEPGSHYRFVCDGDFIFEGGEEFLTGDEMAASSPDIVVEGIRAVEPCDKRMMRLDIQGLDANFWEEGGIVLVEYEDGSVDWVGTAVDNPTPLFFELPREGDEVVFLTVINGAGESGVALELDVSDIAGSRAIEGCAAGGRQPWGSLFVLGLLLLLRGRRSLRW